MNGLEEKIIPLTLLPYGKTGEIVEINGGHCLLSRLQSMGFMQGESIKKMNNNSFGPQMCYIKGCRYGIGRGMADKIYVKYKDETK